MNNPLNDGLLSITFEPNITRQADGSWRISKTESEFSNPQIRINVDNLVLDFKDLSIREIQPPNNLTLTSVNAL